MYNVTDTYKTLIKQPTRYVGISGAVKLRSGELVTFTDKNIESGSLSITDRLNRRGDFRPGGVYSSGLSIGFTGLFAKTNDLDGAVIRLNYLIYPTAEMKLSEAEIVPLGRFYVDGSTIKRTRSTVRLKADDGLMLFDVPTTERSGTLYELVTGACAAAGVSFGMTQAEFEALPNATLSAAINTSRVQTERDLLMYVGMLTGSFARMTRSGLVVEFVPLTCEKDESTNVIIPVREIAGNIRFSTDFSDDTTRIAKIFMRRNGAALYSTLSASTTGSEKLATLELDENPLMSALTDDEVKTALNALLTQLFPCLNRVFDVEFTGDPALEVGDYVRLRGGEIDTSRGYATGMITSQTWTFHGTHRIKCTMPSSLVYSGDDTETAAVMLLADDTAVSAASTTTAPERVQPKSQIEKRLDAIEAGMNGSGNSASALTSYEYLSDTSVKFNGITYTVEKDSTTGLISKISDSNGNSFEPTINSGITDIAWHNAVFAAVAIHSGLKVIPDLVLFSGLNGQWEFKNGLTGFQNIKIDAQTYSGLGKTIYSSGVAVGSLTKSYGRNNQLDGYTNACVIRSNEKINLTQYRKLKILAVAYRNYSGITGAAYFRTGEPAAAQSNVVYDFTGWTKICNCDITSMDYAAPGTPIWYEIDISELTGSHYINLAIQHGSEELVYTAYFDMQQIVLTNQ